MLLLNLICWEISDYCFNFLDLLLVCSDFLFLYDSVTVGCVFFLFPPLDLNIYFNIYFIYLHGPMLGAYILTVMTSS